ncbi:helix-turn-helix transcriptional regulator [Chamaesiphon sp. VAR_48_metabat_135_sub]|uniref:helix-turn-helix transcriptional regulator n=1 Tax=Chamaesiphon sp. VAR_48_metabat_135_sub TaxID=2964699 RepID=UPI00286C6894|nr:helix-turn-helix transcriptional regulator [Chamaesiphon sp. VAR_48_metabat_135_sub]
MGSDRQVDRTLKLRKLMQKVGINSFSKLAQLTGTSAHTIHKLRSNKLDTLRWQTLVKISSVLQISVNELIDIFGDKSISESTNSLEMLQQEYQHLQQQLSEQRSSLQAEFQYQSLQILESFLTYFPAAKYAARNNPDFPASKIFPLVQSIDRLIQQWGVTLIGEIGSEIAYDPRWHQLIEGAANPDELVTVRYTGYRQDNKLIFRAKVSK